MSQVVDAVTLKPVARVLYSYLLPTVGLVITATTGVVAEPIASYTVMVPVRAAFTCISAFLTGPLSTFVAVLSVMCAYAIL